MTSNCKNPLPIKSLAPLSGATFSKHLAWEWPGRGSASYATLPDPGIFASLLMGSPAHTNSPSVFSMQVATTQAVDIKRCRLWVWLVTIESGLLSEARKPFFDGL